MASFRSIRGLAIVVGLLLALALPSAAQGAIPNIPNGAGGDISCTTQGNGQRHCSGIFTTFDGAPIDINVGFPPQPASGPDGDFPIVGMFHGWGGSKIGVTSGGWINDGYAVFSMSDRGWGNSCGALDPKRPQPVCAEGYNHLMDTRFEVRDAQEIFAALADRVATGATSGEGLIDPQAIGVTGGSYGGGISAALGALKNRKMVNFPDPEGTLVPWVSNGGKSMRIAAAQPDIPWTDLAYSLQPNGHTLDYVVDSQYMARTRIGVMKQSWVALLYGAGLGLSNYAAPGTDPDADLTTWYAAINAGEPYDTNPLSADIVDEITKHHSSYYIDDSTAPAPMLFSNGFTDDLFPADEAIRFYNRTRDTHPGTPISMIFTDHGHARGQGKGPDGTFRSRELHNWLDYYVKGTGPQPYQGVQTLTQTCDAPSGGATGPFDDPNTDQPFRAPTWAELAPGEVRFTGAAEQIIAPEVADQGGAVFDPQASAGSGGACATISADDQPGTASYRLDPAPAGGYTLMGSPTIIADINSPSPTGQIAARLLDIDPGTGNESLVARGLYRPEINLGTAKTRQVFQLHPNGWKFAAGHIAKLELLPADQPYGRNSNGQLTVTLENLELRLPVLEEPGGAVEVPAPKIVPPGYEPVQTQSYPALTGGGSLRAPLVPAFDECTQAEKNSLHAAPIIAQDSCNNSELRSSTVTVGSSTTLGTRLGFASVDVCTAPQPPTGICSAGSLGPVPDVRLRGNGSDIVCAAGAPAAPCPGGAGSDYDPNIAGGPYTGNLDSGTDSNAQIPTPICNPEPPNPPSCAAGADMTATAAIPDSSASAPTMRITDSYSSVPSVADPAGCESSHSCSATVRDQVFSVPVVCVATTSGSIGSYCGANTSANALVPGIVESGKQAIVELGQLQVLDSGPDGIRDNSDDEPFAVQGIYIP